MQRACLLPEVRRQLDSGEGDAITFPTGATGFSGGSDIHKAGP